MSNPIKLKVTAVGTLMKAVLESDIDLSYNKKLALDDIERTERHTDYNRVWVDEHGNVYYEFKTPTYTVLNKYEPFVSTLTDASLSAVTYADGYLTFISMGMTNNIANKELINTISGGKMMVCDMHTMAEVQNLAK